MEGIIYYYTNKINDKKYVGATKHPRKRHLKHMFDARHNGSSAFNSAVRKYGMENFIYSILETCSIENLCSKEIYWIKKLDSFGPQGYNLTSGGEGASLISEVTRQKLIAAAKKPRPTMKGRPVSLTTRNKISSALLGRPGKPHNEATKLKMSFCRKNNPNYKWTEERKKEFSNSCKGRKFTEEHRSKIRAAKIGQVCTAETKRKISESKKLLIGNKNPFFGRHHSQESKKRISDAKLAKNGY